MQTIAIDEIDPIALGNENLDLRGLAEPLNTSELAMNYYALDPGQAFSPGVHTHLDQEEVFYILEGTATFETKAEATAASECIEVSAGEAIRFAPGEFQQGRNESDAPVVALALGAPRGPTEGRIPQPCPECEESDVLAVVMDDEGMRFQCPECGTELDAEM
jgi:mannose-6-phosphate isomerase-like protein (cupin superfamily)